jgi:hypothetical protein
VCQCAVEAVIRSEPEGLLDLKRVVVEVCAKN